MIFSMGFLLIFLCTSVISGNSSNVLTVSNVSSQLPLGIDLPKSIRNKGNHTIHTILSSIPKVKITGVGSKNNKSVVAANNSTVASKTGDDDVMLSTTLRNLTQQGKNGGHRSSSSRFLDRLASKVSLVSLASSKVGGAFNETSLRNGRFSANASLTEQKNVTDRSQKIMEKRSVQNSTMTDRASSFFQNLPSLLMNTTSNVTSWAKRLFGAEDRSSKNFTAKKVTRDTSFALRSLINTTEFNTSVLNSTENRRPSAGAAAKEEERIGLNNSSPLLNLTVTILKREIRNLTADVPTAKKNISSDNATVGIEREFVEVPINSTVESELDFTNLTGEIPEKITNSSLRSKLTSLNNRTKRHSNCAAVKSSFKVPSVPPYLMHDVTTPNSIPYPSHTTPVVPYLTYGMVPGAVYGMPPASSAYSTPAPYAPVPTSAYDMASAPANLTPVAPAFGMNSVAQAPAAPAYGYTTPAPYAPSGYEQSTESYYTAPLTSYITNTPYVQQYTESPYGAPLPGAPLPGAPLPGAPLPGAPLPGAPLPGAPLPGAPLPVSYHAQPYGSLSSRPSPTGSPWF